MRNSKWLVVAGLALVAAFAPGCATKKPCDDAAMKSKDGKTRMSIQAKSSAFPGVVEIYRYGERPVGYVCLDYVDPTFSYWLLEGDEQPPVMPWSTSWTDDVIWHKISSEFLTGPELCLHYGDTLIAPRLWHVKNETVSDCTH